MSAISVILSEEQVRKIFPSLNEEEIKGSLSRAIDAAENGAGWFADTYKSDNFLNTNTSQEIQSAATSNAQQSQNSAQETMNQVLNIIFGNSNGAKGYCARGVYYIALGYTKGDARKNALSLPSGFGNADSATFLNSLLKLGYTIGGQEDGLQFGVMASKIKEWCNSCNIGDVIIYAAYQGGKSIKRHTQICTSTGNIETKFSCDNRTNYNTYFVYKNTSQNGYLWNIKWLKAPHFATNIVAK